jgi:virulence-associated protein VagC
MAETKKSTKTAKLVVRGKYQYVILPKEFEFKGDKVRVRTVAGRVLLEPMSADKRVRDTQKWLAELRRHPLSADCFRDALE